MTKIAIGVLVGWTAGAAFVWAMVRGGTRKPDPIRKPNLTIYRGGENDRSE